MFTGTDIVGIGWLKPCIPSKNNSLKCRPWIWKKKVGNLTRAYMTIRLRNFTQKLLPAPGFEPTTFGTRAVDTNSRPRISEVLDGHQHTHNARCLHYFLTQPRGWVRRLLYITLSWQSTCILPLSNSFTIVSTFPLIAARWNFTSLGVSFWKKKNVLNYFNKMSTYWM